MRKKSYIKIDLVIGIVILFIVSAVSPLTTGIDTESDTVDVELEEMLDNLRFLCTGPSDFNSIKYEYYKEKLLSQYLSRSSNDEIVVESEKRDLAIIANHPSTSISSYGGHMNSPWPIKCHNLHHTSQSPYSTADNPGIEKWRFLGGHWIEQGSVIDNDGIIYFGEGWGDLIALYPDGTLKWKYELDGQILGSTPAIAEDGTIYVGAWDNYLYAMNPDGTRKWKFNARSADISSSPAIADDGTIYFGTLWNLGDGGKIFAVNPDGTEKWYYQTGYHVSSCPAIGNDGTIYIGSGDDYLYAMWSNGSLRWRFKTGDWIKGPPSIADDGTIYIGSFDGYLYALYPNTGTMKWKCRIGDGSETNPSIANDGTIYIGGNKLYAVYPNGTLKWSFSIGDGFIHTSAPAISADGTIYFGTDDTGYIYAVNPDGTQKWRKKIANKWVESSPSIAEDGTIYIGSSIDMSKGYLHAFGPQETNDSPTSQSITGPTEGKTGTEYDFTFKATDPDRNPVSFYIEWGDGETTGWTKDYASGEKATYSHTWSEKGNYTIRAKAKDTFGLESDWTEFDIGIIKKNKAVTSNMLLQRILERFPFLQKIIQNLGL